MNQILVLFDSRSGNVAKMAALVAEGAQQVPETEVRATGPADPRHRARPEFVPGHVLIERSLMCANVPMKARKRMKNDFMRLIKRANSQVASRKASL